MQAVALLWASDVVHELGDLFVLGSLVSAVTYSSQQDAIGTNEHKLTWYRVSITAA